MQVSYYKCIPKPVLHTYTKSLISPMKNWSQIDSWHPDHLNACDPKRPNVGSCIVSLRWTVGFESNSIPNKCHHSQSTKCVFFILSDATGFFTQDAFSSPSFRDDIFRVTEISVVTPSENATGIVCNWVDPRDTILLE